MPLRPFDWPMRDANGRHGPEVHLPRTNANRVQQQRTSTKYYSRGFTLGYRQCPSVAALGRCAAT